MVAGQRFLKLLTILEQVNRSFFKLADTHTLVKFL